MAALLFGNAGTAIRRRRLLLQGVISDIKEGNIGITKNPSIKVLEANEKETVLEIGSGAYIFSSKMKRYRLLG